MKYIIQIGKFLKLEQEQPLRGERFFELCNTYSFKYSRIEADIHTYYFEEKSNWYQATHQRREGLL